MAGKLVSLMAWRLTGHDWKKRSTDDTADNQFRISADSDAGGALAKTGYRQF